MAEARLLQSNFTGGELSPRMAPHADLQRYFNGLSVAANCLIHPLGGAVGRAGSVWAVDPKVIDAPARLLAFVRSAGDAVGVLVQRNVLRFIDLETRAYILSGGSPYERSCPWTDADLAHLVTWQSADVMYIADARGTAPVRALRRNGAADWTLAELALADGPFLPEANTVSLTYDGVVASIVLTLSSGLFTAGHVGALVRIREKTGVTPYRRWESNIAVTLGELRVNAGRAYVNTVAGTTGNNAPIHDAGEVSDGAIPWRFLHDGAGVARITAVTNATTAVATVLTASLPGVAGDTTTNWAFGAFSGAAGHPVCGAINQERFVLGGAELTPDTLYLGRTGGYSPSSADFKPGLGSGQVIDSDAVTRTFANGRVEPVAHMLSAERLYCFTPRGVHVVGGPSQDEGITPSAASARQRSSHGAAPEVAPVRLGDSILFAARGREAVRELVADERVTRDISLVAEHIAGRGVAELVVVDAPRHRCYARLDDGGVGALTFEPVEEVVAWTPLSFSGVVESLAEGPKADGRDELWMVVRRTVAGVQRRSVEYMGQPWSARRTPLELGPFVDAAGFLDLWNVAATTATLTLINDTERRARITMSAAVFTGEDVGRTFGLRRAAPLPGRDPGADAAIARVRIDAVTNALVAEGELVSDGAASLNGSPTTLWARMTATLTGLARLNGLAIDVLGDGAPMQGLVVAGGSVTLPEPVARAWAGLPVVRELADMPPAEGAPDGTALAREKRVEGAWLVAEHVDAATLLVSDHPTRPPEPVTGRTPDDLSSAPPVARRGFVFALSPDGWGQSGVVRIRHAAPTPFEVLGIVKRVKTA